MLLLFKGEQYPIFWPNQSIQSIQSFDKNTLKIPAFDEKNPKFCYTKITVYSVEID